MKRVSRTRMFNWPALVVAIVIVTTTGCSIFEPREAEIPGSSGTPFIAPDVPSLVFSNMKSGLEDLTGVNYEKSLGDEFTFIPLPSDVDKLGPEVFQDWTKEVEMEVTTRVLADASLLLVSYINPEQIRDEADFADFRAPYELTVTYSSGLTEVFKGVAQFDMQRLGGNWHLIRWTDQEGVEGYATWGYLRGTTRGTS